MTTTVETTPKTALMSYTANKGIEELEKEIAELENTTESEQEPVQEVEETKEKEEGLSAEEQSWKSRYGDLRRHQQQQEKKLKDELDQLKTQIETLNKSKDEMPRTKEQVQAWVKKYPDVAAIVKTLAGNEAVERSKEIDKRLKDIEQMSAQLALEKAEAEIRKIHADFDEIKESEDFHKWVDEQPNAVRDTLYKDIDVAATAQIIRYYKLERGNKKTVPNAGAALSVNTKGKVSNPIGREKVWKESDVQRLTDAEFTKHEEEITSAMREGRFEYDISNRRRA
jgi:DNA repair exonuclease SbcCD ATPase subunit